MGAPADRRPRRRPGENRAGLLAAGTVEFGLRGYAAAQTSAIAERAGVSQPNVYANFSSKRELFFACLAEATAGAPSEGAAAVAGGVLRDEEALLVYQAVAALGDASLAEELRPWLTALREQLGAAVYERVLLRASELLLDA